MASPSRSLLDSDALRDGERAHHIPRWYTHTYNRPIFYHAVAGCCHLMPRRLRLRLARMIAPLFRSGMPQEYAAARRNMTRILPHANPAGIEQVVAALFRNFACVFVDLLSINRRAGWVQQRYVCQVYGGERLQELLAARQGFVAATAHMGNWELAGRLLASHGRPVHVLVAPEQHAAVQQLLRGRTAPPGLHFVVNAEVGVFMQLLRALRRGDIVAVQADRAMGHRGDVALPFFDAPAYFPGGPFVLAAAAQVPVLPCFCMMRPDDRYDIVVDQAIPVSRGGEEAALRRMVGVLERYIAMAPDQWFNFYDVWNDTRSEP
jgi:lauroyl/myristoyl acyltransferase